MANAQTRATMKYQQKMGIISKSFKLKKSLCEEFKEACAAAGVGQGEMISKLMTDFIIQQKELQQGNQDSSKA